MENFNTFLKVLMCGIFNTYTEQSKGKFYYFIYFALVYTLSKFLNANRVLIVSDNSREKIKE